MPVNDSDVANIDFLTDCGTNVMLFSNGGRFVAEQLGVDRSMVVPHARFVQDLGAN